MPAKLTATIKNIMSIPSSTNADLVNECNNNNCNYDNSNLIRE